MLLLQMCTNALLNVVYFGSDLFLSKNELNYCFLSMTIISRVLVEKKNTTNDLTSFLVGIIIALLMPTQLLKNYMWYIISGSFPYNVSLYLLLHHESIGLRRRPNGPGTGGSPSTTAPAASEFGVPISNLYATSPSPLRKQTPTASPPRLNPRPWWSVFEIEQKMRRLQASVQTQTRRIFSSSTYIYSTNLFTKENMLACGIPMHLLIQLGFWLSVIINIILSLCRVRNANNTAHTAHFVSTLLDALLY